MMNLWLKELNALGISRGICLVHVLVMRKNIMLVDELYKNLDGAAMCYSEIEEYMLNPYSWNKGNIRFRNQMEPTFSIQLSALVWKLGKLNKKLQVARGATDKYNMWCKHLKLGCTSLAACQSSKAKPSQAKHC